MAKKTSSSETRSEDVYNRLSTNSTAKIAKTLYLNAQNIEELNNRCEQANAETELWNESNQKLPPNKRQPRRKKIKPCDVIDDLISRHLQGEI